MKNRLKLAAAVLSAAFALSGTAAFAQSTQTAEPGPTLKNEIVIEDNRTLTTKGNAELMDNVTDNENLQFTVRHFRQPYHGSFFMRIYRATPVSAVPR